MVHGLAYVVVGSVFAHRSGAHMNPAITLALVLTRRCSLLRGLGYIGLQRAARAGVAPRYSRQPN